MRERKLWRKPRHQAVISLVQPILRPFVRWKYHITMEPFPQEGNRPYLILMNHQTGYDQFFVAMTFKKAVYYVATEDIFSLGFASDIIRFLVAPIPIRKQTTDIQAVKNCIRVAREGGSVCMAPEGNRTFHGRTVHINPAVGGLAKKMGLPIAFFRIEGGYGVQPRWSDVVRGGTMRSYVSRVMEPEEYQDLSNEELAEVICRELWVDEARDLGEYPHPRNAEFLERLIYTCPSCGLAPFESNGDILRCSRCGAKIRHKANKELEGIGFRFPHRYVADWLDWQNSFVNTLDPRAMSAQPVFTDRARFSVVHLYRNKKKLINNACVRLFGDKIRVDDREFTFDDLSAVTILGKNKINLYYGKETFQLKGDSRFNAVKYVNFYHRYKNHKAGNANEFLGI